MKTADVIEHFGSQGKTAKALGMRQPSVQAWGEFPPPARQLQIQKITRKALIAEPGCLQLIINPPSKDKQVSASSGPLRADTS